MAERSIMQNMGQEVVDEMDDQVVDGTPVSAVLIEDDFEEEPLYRSLGVMSYQSSLPYDSAFQQIHSAPQPVASEMPLNARLDLYNKILEPVRDIPMSLVLENSAELAQKYDDLNEKFNTAPPLLRKQKSFMPMDLLLEQEQNMITHNMVGFRTHLASVAVH